MSHLLSVKIPPSLLHSLEEVSQRQGVSKGAVVREALEEFLKRSLTFGARIEKITKLHLQNKKSKKLKLDWDKIREECSAVQSPYTPEEEVRLHRRRFL